MIYRAYTLLINKNMKLENPIIELDTHGMNTEQAVNAVKTAVAKAGPFVYRIHIIHGYRGGTKIRSAIREEFSYGREPKVIRVSMGDNEGVTDLILREY